MGGRVLLVDRLPAGFEIENPRLVTSGDVKALSWLQTNVNPVHTEFRDDRFVAAFDFFRAGAKHRARVGGVYRAGGDPGIVRASGCPRGGHVSAGKVCADGRRPPRNHCSKVTA